ncbi:hypothetical protein BBO99_00003140 [Phytophthora kernoviae]|uniref:HTH CENPB-type domain-containing protein n=2 Tax=Phytophthora kernoviae TaxID=325452 RepID=A0A3R7IZS5_9STRA|nr:hypothetical protein G195_003435 [Phytophthora kernoviae 00238/432]KAG2528481.1 hypothetical protein JM16_002800 [Phytophthora kernoviae]RLM95355.1 hypothetical protein BBI17_003147 [Phytophthora kernoviae]RLN82126.1 hypothetical protein BBO99_00003140 [Phytophthora kernoviae]
MGRRGAGRRLSDHERMQILETIQREHKVKNVDLAKQYGVSEGAIRKLRNMKDAIRNRYNLGNEHNRDSRKRGGFKRNAPFEKELYEWIMRMRETQAYQLIPLTQTAVRQQAIILSKNYERMGNFKASPGWFARFCSRHRLDPPTVNAGAAPGAAATESLVGEVAAAVGVPVPLDVPASTESKTLTAADETVFLMDSLAAAQTSAAMGMVDVTIPVVHMGADTGDKPTVEELKSEPPSINEQEQLAAREHNEAALNALSARDAAAARPTEEMQATSEASAGELKPESSQEFEEKKPDIDLRTSFP